MLILFYFFLFRDEHEPKIKTEMIETATKIVVDEANDVSKKTDDEERKNSVDKEEKKKSDVWEYLYFFLI